MANIFGSCTGSLSKKYDLWITVTQNSQNQASNKSNITASFYLRRNDGNSSSAYNLIENQNSVTLSVAGATKISKNITVDTRNNVCCKLASWTGDVVHNNDGTLSVSVSGSFVMGNDNLTGGSVKGSFKCTPFGKVSTLTFEKITVNPGEKISVSVNSSSENFTHKIKWSLGTQSKTQTLSKGVSSADFTLPLSWTGEIKKTLKATLSCVLETYNSGTRCGTSAYSINVVIPATQVFTPSFDLKITRNDNGVPASWNEYVKGISTVTVNPENVRYKYGAEYYSIAITVDNVTKRELPSTFDLPRAGKVKVTVTVKDNRGLKTVKTETLQVCDYTPPSVTAEEFFRCDSSSVRSESGTYAYMKLKTAVSSVNGKNSSKITLKYKKSDLDGWTNAAYTGNPMIFGNGDLQISSSYTVAVRISDSITADGVETLLYLSGADIPFNIRKGGKGAAFGKYSQKDNLLDVGWDLRVNGGIELSGMLNYTKIKFETTEIVEDALADLRFFPALNGVFVRIRVKTAIAFSANDVYTLGYAGDKIPELSSPLACTVGFGAGGQSTAGIVYPNGKIIFRSNVALKEGSLIYINGFYVSK